MAGMAGADALPPLFAKKDGQTLVALTVRAGAGFAESSGGVQVRVVASAGSGGAEGGEFQWLSPALKTSEAGVWNIALPVVRVPKALLATGAEPDADLLRIEAVDAGSGTVLGAPAAVPLAGVSDFPTTDVSVPLGDGMELALNLWKCKLGSYSGLNDAIEASFRARARSDKFAATYKAAQAADLPLDQGWTWSSDGSGRSLGGDTEFELRKGKLSCFVSSPEDRKVPALLKGGARGYVLYDCIDDSDKGTAAMINSERLMLVRVLACECGDKCCEGALITTHLKNA